MTLRCWHEREAAFCDVPEVIGVTSRLAGARKGRESFAVNVGHNVDPHLIGQDDDGDLLGLLGELRVRDVNRRLRRGFRPLQRHHGGIP